MAIRQKSEEPSFWEVMYSFVLLADASLAASRTLFQKLRACLNFTLESNFTLQSLLSTSQASTSKTPNSKESASIPPATPDNLQPILPLCSIAYQHQKQTMKSRAHPLSPPLLNKARHLPPCHFTILPPFLPCHLTILARFRPCLLLTTCPLPNQLAMSLPSNLSNLAA